MANFDFSDFYIKYPGHPDFTDTEIIEDDIVKVIVQKYEMIIFTNKGEVFGDPNFGTDLETFLHKTKVSSRYVEKIINEQIAEYIPELNGIKYELSVSFTPNPETFSDVMMIDFKIKDYEVNAYFA